MPDDCEHLREAAARTEPVQVSSHGCVDCLRMGARWVHLRLCLTCGHVGCCDESPNRHATAHFHDSGHPVIRSYEPEEDWGFCYADGALAVYLPALQGEAAPVHYRAPHHPH